MCVLSFQAFSLLPETLDEIDAMLNEERTRAECFTGLSDAVRQIQLIQITLLCLNSNSAVRCMHGWKTWHSIKTAGEKWLYTGHFIHCGLGIQVVDEYNRREQEIKNLEKELDDKTNELTTYRRNIAEVHSRKTQSHNHHQTEFTIMSVCLSG